LVIRVINDGIADLCGLEHDDVVLRDDLDGLPDRDGAGG
jgi:hypothetical protein